MRGYSRASRDVPPFCIIENLHTVRSLNLVGLKRAGFAGERIAALKEAFRILFRTGGNLKMAMKRVEDKALLTEDVHYLLNFIRSSKKGVAVSAKTEEPN
jgi:UDP-N-acetylglucosamine acyltransferase